MIVRLAQCNVPPTTFWLMREREENEASQAGCIWSRQSSVQVMDRKADWGPGDLGLITNLVTYSNIEGIVRGLRSVLWTYLTGQLDCSSRPCKWFLLPWDYACVRRLQLNRELIRIKRDEDSNREPHRGNQTVQRTEVMPTLWVSLQVSPGFVCRILFLLLSQRTVYELWMT